MIICSKYQSTRDFSFDAATNSFCAEDSTLSKGNRLSTHWGRVYDDACDTGFVLVSHKTGDSILFVLDKTDMNGDEEAGWHYKALKYSGRRPGEWTKVPAHLEKLSVLVIND